MRTHLSKVFYILLIGILAINTLTAQETQCIAVITGLKGNVLVKKAGKPDYIKVKWGNQLFRGDQVKIMDKSSATITYSSGLAFSMGPGDVITIQPAGPANEGKTGSMKKVSSAAIVNMSVLTSRRDDKKDIGALAGLRAVVVEEPIELTSPFNTLIKTNRPTFSWIPKKTYDKYIVNLYSSKGLVWSREVSGSLLNFPETEKALDFGETYFWNVEGEDLLDNKKSSNFKFSVLSNEKSKEILDQESLIRKTFDNEADSSSLHSFLGAYYINQGLLQDAINEFEIISRMNPDAPLPHEILGSLYSDVGNKDKAIEELRKALALSKTEK